MPREWIEEGGSGTPQEVSQETPAYLRGAVSHVAVSVAQEFTEAEKKQARDNIDAASASEMQSKGLLVVSGELRFGKKLS